MNRIPADELKVRMANFTARMDNLCPDWETAMIVSKVNLYYFTGTQQNGILLIRRGKDAVFYVRRSFYRAEHESQFGNIVKINSFKDIAAAAGDCGSRVHLEKEFVPLAYFERVNKYFNFKETLSCDLALSVTRSVKTKYELNIMRIAGKLHGKTLTEFVPSVVRKGISEKELGSEILKYMMDNGHQGIARLSMFNTEMFLGQVCFGDNSMYFNTFDGPGGVLGISPAAPFFGNADRLLDDNELIFIDIGCGIDGYYTDKTQVYSLGSLPDIAYEYHDRCVKILEETVSRLKPDAIPSKIYEEVMGGIDDDFLEYFMGVKDERVKFLGHGIGLVIDEYPVIAKGFDAPIVENNVFAVEPKRGIPGIGLVGLENTYVVTSEGAECITGCTKPIIRL